MSLAAVVFVALTALAPGNHRVALGERAYIVHVPPGAGARPLPVVIYPDGTGRLARMLTWNAGTCCGASVVNQVDDVGKRTPIDRKRVFATGMSNGAMMSYRLAAEASDLVSAIAPVAGSMVLVRFHPTKPVSIMHIHSVDDPRAGKRPGRGQHRHEARLRAVQTKAR
jgi:polyhydroxybutyrate depolymerase